MCVFNLSDNFRIVPCSEEYYFILWATVLGFCVIKYKQKRGEETNLPHRYCHIGKSTNRWTCVYQWIEWYNNMLQKNISVQVNHIHNQSLRSSKFDQDEIFPMDFFFRVCGECSLLKKQYSVTTLILFSNSTIWCNLNDSTLI